MAEDGLEVLGATVCVFGVDGVLEGAGELFGEGLFVIRSGMWGAIECGDVHSGAISGHLFLGRALRWPVRVLWVSGSMRRADHI